MGHIYYCRMSLHCEGRFENPHFYTVTSPEQRTTGLHGYTHVLQLLSLWQFSLTWEVTFTTEQTILTSV